VSGGVVRRGKRDPDWGASFLCCALGEVVGATGALGSSHRRRCRIASSHRLVLVEAALGDVEKGCEEQRFGFWLLRQRCWLVTMLSCLRSLNPFML